MAVDKLSPGTGDDLSAGRTTDTDSRSRADGVPDAPARPVALLERDSGASRASRAATIGAAHATIGTARLNRLMNPPVGGDRRPPSNQSAETLPIGAAEAAHAPSGGQPLETAVRGTVEHTLGADLSGLRVHTGPEANAAAESLSARAFTSGKNIFLGPGESTTDTQLIAHEAAHVVQDPHSQELRPYTAAGGDEKESQARGVADAAVRESGGPAGAVDVLEVPALNRADDPDPAAAAVGELGVGGGGGAIRPSALDAGIATFAGAMDASEATAAGQANAVLASAPVPHGPAAAAAPQVRDPLAPRLEDPAALGAPPAEHDGRLGTEQTVVALDQHATSAVSHLRAAHAETTATAAEVTPGPIAPTHHQPAPRMRPLERSPAERVPAVGVDLEAPVARVLDAGFSARLSETADAAGEQRSAASSAYRGMVDQADAAHREQVAANEAAATGEIQRTQARATGEVARHKSAWLTENAGLFGGLLDEVEAERAGAAAGVLQQGTAADAAAAKEIADATKQAQPERGQDDSLWDRAKGLGRRVVHAGSAALSSLSEGAKRLLHAAVDRARALIDVAQRWIHDRVRRYVANVRAAISGVRNALAAAARRAMAAIRRSVADARAFLDRLVARLRQAAERLLSALVRAVSRALAALGARLRALVKGLIALGRRVLALAGKVRQLLALAGSKVVKGVVRLVRDPAGFLEPFKAQVGRWIAALPGTARRQYEHLVAPLLGVGQASQNVTPGEQATAEPSHGEIVWEYILERLRYMLEHWPSVIGNVLLEMFVPFVAEWRHLPGLLVGIYKAIRDLLAGRFSDSVDHVLAAAREASALIGVAFARLAIVAFVFGSIIGTPIVGEGLMFAIGLGVLGIDIVIQGASIAKAWSNLDRPGRTTEQLDEDYSTIADSIVSLGVTIALLIIAALGQLLGKVLLARFPKVAAALESIRARLRAKLGIKTPRPASADISVPNAPEVAPEAIDYPGRAGLTPEEQRAFDRFIANARANRKITPEYDAFLKKMSADELRARLGRVMGSQPDVEADQGRRQRALETNKSDPLDPEFKNVRDEGDGVTSKFNDHPPSDFEIKQAKAIAARTGERVTLFGESYPGIDGVIGDPPRPLQLKSTPSTSGAAGVFEDAKEAFGKASQRGYKQVEVHITAEHLTASEVKAEFMNPSEPGPFLDGEVVRRIVVWCKGGEVYVPSGPIMPTPPIHVMPEDEPAEPVGAR